MTASEPLLFAPQAGRGLGEAVAQQLGLELAPLEERAFEDGEHKSRPLTSVRGRDTYLVQSLHGDGAGSVNDRLVRLLFLIQNLKDQGAARVTAVLPYLAYARKDRRTQPRDPVNTRTLAQLFEAVGTDRVLTLDVHNLAAYQNAFRIPAEHLEARPLLARYLAPQLAGEEVVVVSPDVGGAKRAEALRQTLGRLLARPVGSAFLEKYRAHGEVWGEAVVGDVAGRTALIADDLVASGDTLARAARACRAHGARRILAAATHGVFSPSAAESLAEPALERLIITDSVWPPRSLPPAVATKLTVLEIAPLLAEAIRRLHVGGSLAALLEPSPARYA
ncbi:ribose-phosphate diphosphokinase [Thiobacter aerophilum]|uniref:ribose-phosphate diphosphokinase n=1 Tax=Thiobacter aerophilum TaxID=3121275 RepID=A0ABV0EBE2_9BURK